MSWEAWVQAVESRSAGTRVPIISLLTNQGVVCSEKGIHVEKEESDKLCRLLDGCKADLDDAFGNGVKIGGHNFTMLRQDTDNECKTLMLKGKDADLKGTMCVCSHGNYTVLAATDETGNEHGGTVRKATEETSKLLG